MPIRPEPILVAAQRWLEVLPHSGEARTRAIFATVARYSDLTTTQYEAALEWLRSIGALEHLSSAVPPRYRVLQAAIETSGSPWLQNADEFDNDPDLLPEEVIAAARALNIDAQTASNFVRAAWGKVDQELRNVIGSEGERALVNLLEGYTDARVNHVSLWNDGFGYDVVVEHRDLVGHLEVKSTTRRQRVTVHLSENELRTAHRDPSWLLVALQLDVDDHSLRSVATIPKVWLAEQAPTNNGDFGRWESYRVDVPMELLQPGLDFITPLLGDNVGELSDLWNWATD